MKRVDTDHLQCQPLQVYIQPIYICTEQRDTIGVHVVTHRIHHSAMDNANGFLQDADQLLLMYQNQDITNCATVKCQQMHHSAMELTNI
jgi:hypothetical protein